MRTAKVIAHRGLHHKAPENSIESFRAALELGCKWIETDVTPISDGTLVIFHDEELERMCGIAGKLTKLKKSDLESLHLLGGKEKIPLLAEVINYSCKQGMLFNFELKTHPSTTRPTHQFAADFLSELRDLPCLISSFDIELLKAVRNLAPNIPIGINFENEDEIDESYIEEINPNSLHFAEKRLLSKDFDWQNKITAWALKGIRVKAWGVDNRTRFNELQNLGVYSVFSDFPDRFPVSYLI